jgi:hypothetical protein
MAAPFERHFVLIDVDDDRPVGGQCARTRMACAIAVCSSTSSGFSAADWANSLVTARALTAINPTD